MSQRIAFFAFLFFFLMSAHAEEKDYSDVIEGKEVLWAVTAQELISNLRTDINVVWFGVVKQHVAFRNQEGTTIAMWLCEQHSFTNPGRNALKEPLEVTDVPSGHFIVSLQLPTLSPEEANENLLSKLKEPSYVILLGKPVQVGEFKGGIPSIMLDTSKMHISDEVLVNFITQDPANK